MTSLTFNVFRNDTFIIDFSNYDRVTAQPSATTETIYWQMKFLMSQIVQKLYPVHYSPVTGTSFNLPQTLTRSSDRSIDKTITINYGTKPLPLMDQELDSKITTFEFILDRPKPVSLRIELIRAEVETVTAYIKFEDDDECMSIIADETIEVIDGLNSYYTWTDPVTSGKYNEINQPLTIENSVTDKKFAKYLGACELYDIADRISSGLFNRTEDWTKFDVYEKGCISVESSDRLDMYNIITELTHRMSALERRVEHQRQEDLINQLNGSIITISENMQRVNDRLSNLIYAIKDV